jgi:hypothetical protein
VNLNLNIESPRFKIGQICRDWQRGQYLIVKKIIERDFLPGSLKATPVLSHGNYWYVMEPLSYSVNIGAIPYLHDIKKFLEPNQLMFCHILLNPILSKPDYFNDL